MGMGRNGDQPRVFKFMYQNSHRVRKLSQNGLTHKSGSINIQKCSSFCSAFGNVLTLHSGDRGKCFPSNYSNCRQSGWSM